MKRTFISFAAVLGLGFAATGLAQNANSNDSGAVFVMTNAADRNEIIAYNRAENGTLREVSKFAPAAGVAAVLVIHWHRKDR